MPNIQKRGETYRIRCSCGYDTTGKQLMKSMTWKPPIDMTPKQAEKELQHQAYMFEEKCQRGQILDSTIKFADYVDIWLKDYAEKDLRKTTLARYKDLLKRILPAIGHIKLEKLQPHHLEEFYKNLAENNIRLDVKYTPCENFKEHIPGMTQVMLSKRAGVSIAVVKSCVQGKNVNPDSAKAVSKALDVPIEKLFTVTEATTLSDKTILHYHRLISSILSHAVFQQVLFSSPCDRVKPPKVKDKKEARYLDEVQAERLMHLVELEPHPYDFIIKMFIYIGLRRGELCGLEWGDINFVKKLLTIERSALYLASEGVFEDTTKNYSSQRIIKVSDDVIQMLTEYKIWQDAQRTKQGTHWIKSESIFTTSNGNPIHPDTVTGWFHDFIEDNKLPDVCVHSLRHTNATLLIASGTPLKTVSNRLGHSNVTTTGNIYTHAIKSADEAAAETIQNIFSPNENRKENIK